MQTFVSALLRKGPAKDVKTCTATCFEAAAKQRQLSQGTADLLLRIHMRQTSSVSSLGSVFVKHG